MIPIARLFALIAAMLGCTVLPASAWAQVDSYRVDANSYEETEITICNPRVRVVMNGDGDTDLDFVITNARGQTVHSDYGLSDRSTAVLNRTNGRQCEDFNLRTTNLGNVWNLLTISLENMAVDNGNPVTSDSYRADANSTMTVDMQICSARVRLNVEGDGDTDLDFVVRDARGMVVHSDYGLNDRTSAVLSRGMGAGCQDFTMEVSNLGSVYNMFVVQLEDLRGGNDDWRGRK